MQRTLFLFVIMVATCVTAQPDPLQGDILSSGKIETESTETKTKLLHAVLAKDRKSEPTTKFLTDAPKIYAFWKGEALQAGDRVRAVWIAEDMGTATHSESEITEATVTAYKPDEDGVFALARPKEGWPVGKYRFEIYVNGKLADKVKFTMEPGPVIEVH